MGLGGLGARLRCEGGRAPPVVEGGACDDVGRVDARSGTWAIPRVDDHR